MRHAGLLLVWLWLACHAESTTGRPCGIADIFPQFDVKRGQLGDWAEEECIIPSDCSTVALNNIHLGNSGTIRLTKALTLLPYSQNLERLHLIDNGIKAEGITALTQALIKHSLPVLKSLHIQKQERAAGDIAAQAIADLIRAKPYGPLNDIALEENGIGDKGGNMLASAVNQNVALKYLSIGVNAISFDILMEVQEALNINMVHDNTFDQKQQCLKIDGSWCNQAGSSKWSTSDGCMCSPCLHGHTGKRCERDVCFEQRKNALFCNGKGSMKPAKQDGINKCTCTCAKGWTGERCQHGPCRGMSSQHCNGRAQPTDVNGNCVCQNCDNGYFGAHCQHPPCFQKTGKKLCNNRGFPVLDGNQCICESCLDGFAGKYCEQAACKKNQVSVNGTCADECEVGKYKNEDADGFHCHECDPECTQADGCTGGGPSSCHKCRHFAKGGHCLRSCKKKDAPDDLNECHDLQASPMTAFLEKKNLHEYTELMHNERISLRVLAIMTQQDLRDLGVSSFGDRKRFSAAMVKIRQSIYNEYISLLIELDLNTPLLEGGEGDHAKTNTADSAGSADEDSECLFDDSDGFTKEFEESAALADFHYAMCTNCPYGTRSSRRDCPSAKRAFRALSGRFHPDAVHRTFPGCNKALKAWATAAMTNVVRQRSTQGVTLHVGGRMSLLIC